MEQEHAGDLDAHRAGRTVVAAAAELGTQRVAHLLAGGLLVGGQGGGIVGTLDVGVQLLNFRHTGDGNGHAGVGQHIPQGEVSVLNSAARQGLHINKALAQLGAAADQLGALLLDNIIGEHHSFDFRHVQRRLKHGSQMRRDADMPHHTGSLCFQQGFHRAAGGKDGFQRVKARVVELVQLDMVGAQVFQAGRQLLFHICLGHGAALGG